MADIFQLYESTADSEHIALWRRFWFFLFCNHSPFYFLHLQNQNLGAFIVYQTHIFFFLSKATAKSVLNLFEIFLSLFSLYIQYH